MWVGVTDVGPLSLFSPKQIFICLDDKQPLFPVVNCLKKRKIRTKTSKVFSSSEHQSDF